MMKGKINEIGDTENGMYAIGQVTGRAYERMLNSPRNKKVDGVVALDPKYGKVAQDAASAAAGGYIQWEKKFKEKHGRKPTDDERHKFIQNYHNGSNDYGKSETERKGVVKINENTLKKIVAESVKKVLDEHMGNYGYHDMEDLMHAITSLINPINDIRYYVRDEKVQKAIKEFEPHFHAFAQAMRNYCDKNGLVLNS